MTDVCPECGGTLYMTSGTRLEFVAECERCLVRYAFAEFNEKPRRLDKTAVVVAAWGFVGVLWYLGGLWAGGNW